MGKKFFEVFPSLKLDTGLRDLYEQVTVEKVSATKRKDFLRVYISSDVIDLFQDPGQLFRLAFAKHRILHGQLQRILLRKSDIRLPAEYE